MKRRTSTVLVTSTPTQRFKSSNTGSSQPQRFTMFKPRYGRSLTNPPYFRTPVEKKNIDVSASMGILAPNQWSELDLLNGCGQGANAGERIGRKLQLRSLLFRWNDSAQAAGKIIRILIVYDKQTDGAVIPPITTILANNTINAPMAMGTSERFIVLVDEYVDAIAGQAAVGSPTRGGKIYRKINLPQHFLNAGNALADISSGAIYAMCCVYGSPTNSGIGYFSRIRYTDV